jgi:hypothetical protein
MKSRQHAILTIRNTNPRQDKSIVRQYRADGTLTITRDAETDEHVIKSRGSEPGDTWTRRVPATRTTVEAGEQLWSIPDNWTQHYCLKAEHGTYGIYHIPESGDDIRVSLSSRHGHLTDAYHVVKTVGVITWTASVPITEDALSDVLEYVSNHPDEFVTGVHEVLQYLRDHPQDAVEEAKTLAKRYAPEAVEEWKTIPTGEFDPFYETFLGDNELVHHPNHEPNGEVMAQVHALLSDFDVVPPSPLVSVTVQRRTVATT